MLHSFSLNKPRNVCVTLSFLIKAASIPVTVKYTARYSYPVAPLIGYGEGTNHPKHRISIFTRGN